MATAMFMAKSAMPKYHPSGIQSAQSGASFHEGTRRIIPCVEQKTRANEVKIAGKRCGNSNGDDGSHHRRRRERMENLAPFPGNPYRQAGRMLSGRKPAGESSRTAGAAMTEWNARDYDQISALQKAMADESLASLTLEGGERVLDIGCGNGKITAEIAARLPRGSVLGVDPSSDMIAYASQHYAQANQANLRFAVADVRQLPFRNEFDLVVSFNALHWVQEQGLALRSIRAALKPAGRTLLRFVSHGERLSLEAVIEQTRHSPRWTGYFTTYHQPFIHLTPDDYATLAERNGLRVEKIDVTDKSWDFGSREGFTAFCHTTFVEWTQHIPETEQAAFIAEVLDRYQQVAGTTPDEANTFKFYQMVAVLSPI
jgi:trans-aconitate 2-methyltransferase